MIEIYRKRSKSVKISCCESSCNLESAQTWCNELLMFYDNDNEMTMTMTMTMTIKWQWQWNDNDNDNENILFDHFYVTKKYIIQNKCHIYTSYRLVWILLLRQITLSFS